ncbi:MAG: VWA domain-containing protein [bacterium]|nr:VWA domain-containing protein [bacterium]
MGKVKKTTKNDRTLFFVCLLIFVVVVFIVPSIQTVTTNIVNVKNSRTLRILSSYENEVVEEEVKAYAKSIDKQVSFTYMGDLDIVSELNNNSSNYDAVWISNSMWLYMLDNSYLTSDSKSISISPVVFGIKRSKALALGLVDTDVTNMDILNLVKEKKIKYVMSSVTQTNVGATAYLGFLSSLAGNPEVLTEEMLDDENLVNDLISLFSGVERVSGDESYLEDMFLNDDNYEAVIASEASLININKRLQKQNKEELYFIYPSDGVAINDSAFAYINSDEVKKETFLEIQSYLLSDDGQKMLEEKGQRTWYGGVSDNSNIKIFNPKWGIDTKKYLNVTKFPSKNVITRAINLYIEKLRKPTHVVFCLDYSGSMSGDGIEELTNAMDYILDYDKASADKLQFSENDKITVITFNYEVDDIWQAESGYNTADLIRNINNKYPVGSTALYDAIISGLDILSEDSDEYTKTIIAMTDGAVNVGTFEHLSSYYKSINSDIPIYSITFGDARESQLEEIAKLSNARVFDGKTNLLEAFKDVRGYN